MLPDLNQLADDIEAADPIDRARHGELEHRLHALQTEFERARAADLVAYVDSARRLVAELAGGAELGPAGALGFAAELVRHVEHAFHGMAEAPTSVAPPLPHAAEHAQGAAPKEAPVDELLRRIDVSQMEERMLGEVMLQLGFVTRAQLEQGLVNQRATDQRIGESLVAIGAASWGQVREAIAVQEQLRRSARPSLRLLS